MDIGSNTTRLLVADVVGALPVEVLAHKVHTHLGRALRACEASGAPRTESLFVGDRDSVLTAEEVAARVARGVAEQVSAARGAGAERLRVVATAAVRDAAGGEALCLAVREVTGVPVEVLACEEEARLAFLGATRTAPGTEEAPGDGAVAVVDVGGGSTELVVGTPGGAVRWSASVPLGSGLLADDHFTADPPTPADLEAVRARVTGALRALTPPLPVARALAVGGSAASLAKIAGPRLDAARVGVAIAGLTAEPAAAVADRTGLLETRMRLLPAGLLVLAAAADVLGRPLELGCGGLREGVCLELAAA